MISYPVPFTIALSQFFGAKYSWINKDHPTVQQVETQFMFRKQIYTLEVCEYTPEL